MFPLSGRFRARTYFNAFILNALATAMIAALAVAISADLNNEDSAAYKYFNSLDTTKNLTYTHKMSIVFVTTFLGAIVVFFSMYAIFGFGGGMIIPLNKIERKKIKFI